MEVTLKPDLQKRCRSNLVGCNPTFAKNGRSGASPIPGYEFLSDAPFSNLVSAPKFMKASGPSRRGSAYEISKSSGFRWISGFQFGFLDFWISKWISGFQSGFLDFKVDFWISSGFLDFKVDFWISSGFLDFAISENTAHEQS